MTPGLTTFKEANEGLLRVLSVRVQKELLDLKGSLLNSFIWVLIWNIGFKGPFAMPLRRSQYGIQGVTANLGVVLGCRVARPDCDASARQKTCGQGPKGSEVPKVSQSV